jgi:tRNA threonylcarbamoyladenosine biosynthesis protein TsaE
MSPVAVRLATVEDTRAYGRELASVLRAGDLIVLSGPLGAGKTVLAQGIGAGLEVPGEVTSPTFVIARVHRGGRLPFVHVDAYRLGSVVEVDDLDLDASVEESVTVVEWGGGIVEQLADAYLEVRIDRHDDDTREVALVPHHGDWPTRVAVIAALLVRPKCRPTTSTPGRSARRGPPDQGSAGRH